MAAREVILDGSHGEGGGQIVRSALTLSLLTGRPFRLQNVRANRSKPGLRPQHLAAIQCAAALGSARVEGASVGSRAVSFEPAPYRPADLTHDIGTAGATALVLHTLHLAVAARADAAIRLVLRGGTFNEHAPSFPFLRDTWQTYQMLMGLRVAVTMPRAGFYPIGGGQLEAWIEPGQPAAVNLIERGRLTGIRVTAGVLNLTRNQITDRLNSRVRMRLAEARVDAPIDAREEAWSGPGLGAAVGLTALFGRTETHGPTAATFVGLGAPGKPAETVADEAAAELVSFLESGATVDPHSADQLLLPLCLAQGPSAYSVAAATDHLKTNIAVIQAFVEREIRVTHASEASGPATVQIGS